MSPRRAVLQGITVRPDTHPGLWMDAYLLNEAAGAKAETMRQAVEGKSAPDGYRQAFERWFRSFDLAIAAKTAQVETAETQGRLVIGLGNKSVLEMGIRLDHTWGVPILPGSALKGLASRTAHLDAGAGSGWNRPGKDLKQAAGDHNAFLFGTTENSGAVIFHDALWDPESRAGPLELDVMTVHHPAYYQDGHAPPSDMDSPNPVSFVTATGKFSIVLEARPGVDPTWLSTAFQLLAHGLEQHGLGAKTNAGYGRMKLKSGGTASVGPSAAEQRAEWFAKVDISKPGDVAGLVPALEKLPVTVQREIAQKLLAKHKDLVKAKAEKEYIKKLRAMAEAATP